MPPADNIKSVDFARQSARRILTVARRRANRVDDLHFVVGFRFDGFGCVEKSFQFYRRLRNNQRLCQTRQICNFRFIANDKGVFGRIAFDANHFRVVRISDDDYVTILSRRAGGEFLNFGDKRTGRVDYFRGFFAQFTFNLGRHAVSADDCRFATFDLNGRVYRGDALGGEPLHFLVVVNQRSKSANRIAIAESLFDHLDGAFDAEAKSVFIRQ